MILGKQSIAGLALALFVATTLPAQAGAALLHGKKKKDDDLSTSRKPTPAQNALIDKATSQGGSSGKMGFFKHSLSAVGSLGGSLHLTFHEAGFVQMLLMDSNNFDRQHYNFGYVRNDFLGNTPTAVFDVTPISNKKDFGRFFGRVWIEARNGNVVRFNGDFAGTEEDQKEFYHFDSW